MPLVTVHDVEALTRQNFTAEEEAAVQLLIDMTEGELRDFVGRPVTPTVILDERVTIPPSGRVFLHNTPVISVQAIHYADRPTDPFTSTYQISGGGLLFAASTFTSDVLVDYTAGLDAPDNLGLKSILLGRLSRIVAKMHDDALGVSSLAQEGYNAAYLAEGWTEQELKLAERRRRRVVRTGSGVARAVT